MIEVIDHGPVRELRLAHPPANALGPELLSALATALAQAPTAGAHAIVLSGAPGRFSGGMDVPALLAMDHQGLHATWSAFFSVLRDLATSPVPVVAALTGHSPAGGTVLALFADYRILAEGPYVVGLNEVQVGLPVPSCLFETLVFVVGRRQATRLAVGGLLISPAEALAAGLVDEVVPVAEVVPRAVAWARTLLERPPQAMAATRSLARRPLQDAALAMNVALVDDVVAAWQGEECQRTMRALVDRLRTKAGAPSAGETKAGAPKPA